MITLVEANSLIFGNFYKFIARIKKSVTLMMALESAGRTYSRGKIIRQFVLIAINAQASGDFIYCKTVFPN